MLRDATLFSGSGWGCSGQMNPAYTGSLLQNADATVQGWDTPMQGVLFSWHRDGDDDHEGPAAAGPAFGLPPPG